MAVSYKKLWKLLIDKDKTCAQKQASAQRPLQKWAGMAMSPQRSS